MNPDTRRAAHITMPSFIYQKLPGEESGPSQRALAWIESPPSAMRP